MLQISWQSLIHTLELCFVNDSLFIYWYRVWYENVNERKFLVLLLTLLTGQREHVRDT